jgi:hypothetical protein
LLFAVLGAISSGVSLPGVAAMPLHSKDPGFFDIVGFCFLSISVMAAIPVVAEMFNTMFQPPKQRITGGV